MSRAKLSTVPDFKSQPVYGTDGPAYYRDIRATTDSLTAALSAEDQCVQSMPDASPAKWHRAHTSWFFEQFVLQPYAPGYRCFDHDFSFLFNSYYEAAGARHPRPARGLLTRPATAQIDEYRAYVDAAMLALLADASPEIMEIVVLGLQHEQQHQELLVTDMLHAFAQNPLTPAMLPDWIEPSAAAGPARFIAQPGGLIEIGHSGDGFAFDNETPRHRVFLEPYYLASCLVRNRDWQDFIADGGYRTPALWMSEGWETAQAQGWGAPLYWRDDNGGWMQMTPAGLIPLAPDAPVRHISWYEADAYARWANARLPSEAEWETAFAQPGFTQMTGHVWQWTSSAYGPYPGFRPAAGMVGEYNGKFMINQMVLRGGSAATPPSHARPSYRNFFHPDRRWQFTGLRLAKNV
jgi:ergothioneine biosynthesis protein EgtB